MATRSFIRGSRRAVSGRARKGFEWERLDQAIDKLRSVATVLTGPKVKERALMPAGIIVADEIRSRAPYDEKRTKGTHIRDAVFVDAGDPDKPDVLVGVNHRKAPHAHLQEHGWIHMPGGQPYFRPGVVAAAPRAKEVIITGILEVIDEEMKR